MNSWWQYLKDNDLPNWISLIVGLFVWPPIAAAIVVLWSRRTLQSVPHFLVTLTPGLQRSVVSSILAWKSISSIKPAASPIYLVRDLSRWQRIFLCQLQPLGIWPAPGVNWSWRFPRDRRLIDTSAFYKPTNEQRRSSHDSSTGSGVLFPSPGRVAALAPMPEIFPARVCCGDRRQEVPRFYHLLGFCHA
jgi:hypothetical protein